MQPSMSLLYAGLDPVRAGEVITELDSLGVPYEIKGEAIFIRKTFATKRDSLCAAGRLAPKRIAFCRGRIGRDGGNDVPGSRDDAAIYVVALCRP